MPTLKTYNIFISHAWKYGVDYERMVLFLNEAKYFNWRNFSVPKHDPVLDPDEPEDQKTLTKELKEQIRPTHCVLILAGMYAAYSFWIQKEIDLSVDFNKPVIGIKPWGQEIVPKAVSDIAKVIVGWNTYSILSAIREHSL